MLIAIELEVATLRQEGGLLEISSSVLSLSNWKQLSPSTYLSSRLRSTCSSCNQAPACVTPCAAGNLECLQSSPLLYSVGSKDLTSQAAAYPPGSASSLNWFTAFSEEELGGMSRSVFSVLHVPVHIFSGKGIDYAICLQSDPIS